MGAIDSCLAKALRVSMSCSTVPGISGSLSRHRLARALAYIHDHLHENVRLDDIAAATGLSVYHFSRAFRNTMGVSPYRYLLRCRIEKVREMLSDDGRTLADIAAAAGFADQSHMSNVFKKFTGLTPRSARYQYQQESPQA